MTETPKSKNLVLGLVSRQKAIGTQEKPVTGGVSTETPEHEAPEDRSVSLSRMRTLMIKGESKDPIAGKRLRESGFAHASVKLRRIDYQRLKMLAVLENRSLNYYLTEAVEQYLVTIEGRLPDIP